MTTEQHAQIKALNDVIVPYLVELQRLLDSWPENERPLDSRGPVLQNFASWLRMVADDSYIKPVPPTPKVNWTTVKVRTGEASDVEILNYLDGLSLDESRDWINKYLDFYAEPETQLKTMRKKAAEATEPTPAPVESSA